jgi:cobalt/nickel transport system permease protein
MDIYLIDYWAQSGQSRWHQASALAKISGTALTIAAVVLSGDIFVLVAVYLLLAAVVAGTRLGTRRILLLAAYPGIFAVLFALSRWDGDWLTPATIIAKALTAALATVLLIITTPYPDVFAAFQRVFPRLVGDALFLTYRAFFLTLESMGHLLTALRLRGGLVPGHYVSNARNIASSLGLLLVNSLDMSQRLYDVLSVRGYNGRLAGSDRWRRLSLVVTRSGPESVACDNQRSLADWPPLGLGVLALALSLAGRAGWLFGLGGRLIMVTAALAVLVGVLLYPRWGSPESAVPTAD